MADQLNPCPLWGFKDIYILQRFDSPGLEHWYTFCNYCKTSFRNEYVEESKSRTIEWWNSLNKNTSDSD